MKIAVFVGGLTTLDGALGAILETSQMRLP
jgi:hypothetical protein